ncbi:phosphatase PAP2 family protein [Streptomyces lunaelactis]|uniref:phosphatase PAP2 family protein n=2 Tax=Streptomyces lunaelactis TaxID=1535768 RepID=UPI0015856B49|nr:phosphatase PAP2 family protein [Streptomyces lunaelactis]NUK95230.1 phosphatase PAP2 family protein [Streptomyces lunaelactis]
MHFQRPVPPTPPMPSSVAVAARTGAVLAVASVVLVILVVVSWSPLTSFDRTVTDGLHRWAVTEPGLTHVNRVLTDWVWDPWTMRALVAVAVVWLCLRREWLLALWVAVTSAVGTYVQQGLKSAVGQERPQWSDPVDTANYAAFPSGHAMTAMVTCALLLWLLKRHAVAAGLWRWCAAAAAASVVGVGLTRLYLGVHWPSDVLGGWLMGACLVALSVAAYERMVLSRER